MAIYHSFVIGAYTTASTGSLLIVNPIDTQVFGLQ
jgi:hypothetical protein